MSLFLATPVVALDPDVPLKKLRHTAWLPKDGLPPVALRDIAQTSDGNLWIGTFGGLYQFDGVHFERVPLPGDPKLTSASVYSLYAPRTGGLWIGFTFGGVGFLKDGDLKLYNAEDGVPRGSVRSFAEDETGLMSVSTSSGVAQQDASGRWQRIPIEATSPSSPSPINILQFDSKRTLWATGPRGLYRQLHGATSFELYEKYPKKLNEIKLVLLTPDGSAWLAGDTAAHRISRASEPIDETLGHSKDTYIDREGSLWIADDRGVLRTRVEADGETIQIASSKDIFGLEEGLVGATSLVATKFLETRDGQMWYLTAASLERFSTRAVTPLPLKLLTPSEPESLTLGVGGNDELLLTQGLGPLQVVAQGKSRDIPDVTDVVAIARIADGSTWAGGEGKFWRQQGDGWRPVMPPSGIGDSEVQAIAGRNGNDVWASIARRGVFHFQSGAWRANGDVSGLPTEPAVTLAWDANENLWLGYADGRIARLQGSSVQMFTAAEGADVGVVTALLAHGSSIWAGGEFGLRRWNGRRFVTIHADRERAFDFVTGIVETALGDVWLNSALGIVHIPAADATRADTAQELPLVVDVFDQLDGFAGSGTRVRPLPTAVEGKDGTIWFSSNVGVFSIDPKTSVKPRTPPYPLIKDLVTNGKRYEPSAPIVLEKGTRNLQIDFVGLDLELPERVRYRIKLDRVDAEWRDVGTRRQAFYTNLGAGDYRFHVVSTTDGRLWSPQEAAIGFRINPTFTETVWFSLMCVMAVIGALALLLRLRGVQVARRLRWKLETQLAERDRIARELHDTLLQSTQGLILRFQAISNRMPTGDANREQMDAALERADEVLTEGRDRVRGLRRATTQRSTLACVLRAIGDEFSADAQIAFRFESTGEEPPLSLEVADEIQRIVSEALLNACRHANASAVELRLVNGPRELVVLVEDDGVGIDSETARSGSRPGHWGLRGMHERSERIGAVLTIGAREGGGTRVELRVPIGNAERRS